MRKNCIKQTRIRAGSYTHRFSCVLWVFGRFESVYRRPVFFRSLTKRQTKTRFCRRIRTAFAYTVAMGGKTTSSLVWVLLVFCVWRGPAHAEPTITQSDLASWDTLQTKLAATPEIDSPAKFLAALPLSIRSGYSLVWKSGTPDNARVTALTPRVILHGDATQTPLADGRLMMGLVPGSQRVELIYSGGGRFEPHVLDFPKGAKPPKEGLPRKDVLALTLPPPPAKTAFDTNVGECFGCHVGAEEKGRRRNIKQFLKDAFVALWRPDPHWSGTLGESHGQVTEAEAQMLQALKVNPEAVDLFEHLPGFSQLTIEKLHSMNRALGNKISYQNAHRILAQLRRNPNYLEFRPALIAALSGESDFWKKLPARFEGIARGNEVAVLMQAHSRNLQTAYGKQKSSLHFTTPDSNYPERDTLTPKLELLYSLMQSEGGGKDTLPWWALSTVYHSQFGGSSLPLYRDGQGTTFDVVLDEMVQERAIEKWGKGKSRYSPWTFENYPRLLVDGKPLTVRPPGRRTGTGPCQDFDKLSPSPQE